MSDTTSRGWLRVRSVVDRHLIAVAGVVVVLLLVGGFVTYDAWASPDRETVTEQVSAWESVGEFDHEATVVNGSRAFDEGAVLSNRTVYFTSASPVLDGTFRYSYAATESGSIDVETTVELLVRSVAEGEESSHEYWRFAEELASGSDTLAPDETHEIAFSQDVRAIEEEIRALETDLGQSPGTTETAVVATVRLDGTRNGREVDRRRTYRLPIAVEEAVYRVENPGPVADSGNREEQRLVTVEPGPLTGVGGPAVLVAGLVGLAGLAAGRYRGSLTLTDREREVLGFQRERSEFDEWISEAYVPSHRVGEAETHVKTTSLADLVDLAIDNDRRVLETPDRNQFVVLDGEVVYTYEAPAPLADGEEL